MTFQIQDISLLHTFFTIAFFILIVVFKCSVGAVKFTIRIYLCMVVEESSHYHKFKHASRTPLLEVRTQAGKEEDLDASQASCLF